MRLQKRLFVLGTLAIAALSVGTASASTILWTTSFAAWQGEITAGSGVEAPQFANGSLPSGQFDTAAGTLLSFATGNYTVTGPDAASYSLAGTVGYGSHYTLPVLEGPTDGIGTITIAPPVAGGNAFLLAIGSTTGAPVTVTLSDGSTTTVSPGMGGLTLLGVSVSHPVSYLTLSTAAGNQAVLADFYIGTSNLTQDAPPAATSEAASILLTGGGFLILFGARRKVFSALIT